MITCPLLKKRSKKDVIPILLKIHTYLCLEKHLALVRGPHNHPPRVDSQLGGPGTQAYSELWVIRARRSKAESANGRGTQGEIQRKPGTSFQNPLPVQLGRLPRVAQCWGFYQAVVTQAPSAWHVPNSRPPEEKQVFRHEPHCLHNSSGKVRHSYQSGGWDDPDTQVPEHHQGQPCTRASQKPSVGTLSHQGQSGNGDYICPWDLLSSVSSSISRCSTTNMYFLSNRERCYSLLKVLPVLLVVSVRYQFQIIYRECINFSDTQIT